MVSEAFDLPPILLAGVAWVEAGGDPNIQDDIAHSVRSFDHSGDPYLEFLTITKKPELTSLGNVSIQIRRAGQSLGRDFQSFTGRNEIIKMLKNDQLNLFIVGKHLAELKEIDFPGQKIGDYEIKIIGARYNRGPTLSIDRIKKNTSYGDFILQMKNHLQGLMR